MRKIEIKPRIYIYDEPETKYKKKNSSDLLDTPQWQYKGGSKSNTHYILNYENTRNLGAYSILIKNKGDHKYSEIIHTYGPNKVLKNKEMLLLLEYASRVTKACIIQTQHKKRLIYYKNPLCNDSIKTLTKLKTLLEQIELSRTKTLVQRITKSPENNEIKLI